MKVTAFHVGDGDCLLLESADDPPKRMLVDGGRKTPYKANVRPVIGKLDKLDVVCVSHIDDDHISGILQLFDDEVAWRVHAFHQSLDPNAKKPPFSRPPTVGEVWHNGLYRLVGDDIAPEVELVLGNVATLVARLSDEDVQHLAARLDDIATGERSSMELSRRLSARQLGITINERVGGALFERGTGQQVASSETISVGGMNLALLGPTRADIDKLRTVWKKWLDNRKKALAKLQQEMLEDEQRLGTSAPVDPRLANALGQGLAQVTEANVASITFLVEEQGKTILLTGDARSAELLAGLEHHGKLDAHGRIHVSLLKVQHHGALANVTTDFVQRVTADHYLFCGNGAHHNPELEVVESFARARFDGIDGAQPVGPASDFTFWFTSSKDTSSTKKRKKHMADVHDKVETLKQDSLGRMHAHFDDAGSFEIPL